MMAARREFVDDGERPHKGKDHDAIRSKDTTSAFLAWVGRHDRNPDVTELGDLYQEWQSRRESGEQATLGGDGR